MSTMFAWELGKLATTRSRMSRTAPDELAPERLERRVPVEAREAAHLEDGVAEVPESSVSGAAVARVGVTIVIAIVTRHEADDGTS